MIESTLPHITEIARIPAPAPRPQSLAHDGRALWVGSWETEHVFGMDPHSGNVFEDTIAPGKPVGCAIVGDELRFVVSQNGDEDNRFIRRYVPGHGFKTSDSFACPDDTGSFLAYDGAHVWLSQSANKRIMRLDADAKPTRIIDIGTRIMGATWYDGTFYLMNWFGKENGGSQIGRIDATAEHPTLEILATVPFVGVAIAFDGQRFWTNDHANDAIVCFTIEGRA